MNNILLSSIINYDKEGIYKLELTKDVTINIKEKDIRLFIITKEDIEIDFNIEKDTTIYNISLNNSTININLYNKSSINFYNVAVTNEKRINKINVYHKEKETKSNVISNGISYDEGNLSFIVNGYIKKNAINSICNQASRTINLNKGKSQIEPNLYIEEYNSIANHSSYTGPFDDKTLFYLETKGINRKDGFKLLLSGFLKLIELPKDYEEILNDILNRLTRR